MYLLCQDMPRVRTCSHVGPSHVAAVLSLPPDRQASLLDRAEHDRWSVRRLREAVVELHRVAGERRGRPRRAPSDRGQQEVRTAIQALERAEAELSTAEPGASLLVRVRQALALLTGGELPAGTGAESRRPHSHHRALGSSRRVA